MINKVNKNELRKKRSLRVRKNVHGTTARPRLSVYRSLNHIYAQVINDENGTRDYPQITNFAGDNKYRGWFKIELYLFRWF